MISLEYAILHWTENGRCLVSDQREIRYAYALGANLDWWPDADTDERIRYFIHYGFWIFRDTYTKSSMMRKQLGKIKEFQSVDLTVEWQKIVDQLGWPDDPIENGTKRAKW